LSFPLLRVASAHDIAKTQRHSTVTGEDVLAAVEELEFDMFLDPLQAYLKGAGASQPCSRD